MCVAPPAGDKEEDAKEDASVGKKRQRDDLPPNDDIEMPVVGDFVEVQDAYKPAVWAKVEVVKVRQATFDVKTPNQMYWKYVHLKSKGWRRMRSTSAATPAVGSVMLPSILQSDFEEGDKEGDTEEDTQDQQIVGLGWKTKCGLIAGVHWDGNAQCMCDVCL